MSQQIPNVLHDLSFPDQAHLNLPDGDTLAVGSGAWFNWLESNPSFHFDSGDLSFTARKHGRASGDFWYGYRKLGKQLGSAYLGKAEVVTLPKLLEVASKLAVPKPEKQLGKKAACITKQSDSTSSYAKLCLTSKQEAERVDQVLSSQEQEVRQELHNFSKLEDKLDRCQRDRENLQMQNQRLLADQARSDAAIGELRQQLAEAKADADQSQKLDNDWYCRYQELIKQSDLWREKADERDRFFPALEQEIANLKKANASLWAALKLEQARILQLEQERDELRSQLAEEQSKVGKLEDSLRERDRSIEALRLEKLQAEKERDELRQQLAEASQTQSAKLETVKSTVNPDAIALLQKAVIDEKKGGLFKSNRATPLKNAIEEALKLLDY